jgi:hypothetical protein
MPIPVVILNANPVVILNEVKDPCICCCRCRLLSSSTLSPKQHHSYDKKTLLFLQRRGNGVVAEFADAAFGACNEGKREGVPVFVSVLWFGGGGF